MGTRTLFAQDGTLRHGHPSNNDPVKMQYHAASTVHRNDPDAHERERSWDIPHWTYNNRYFLHSSGERQAALDEARIAHDAARNVADGYRHHPRPRPAPAPASDADDDLASMLTHLLEDVPALVERVEALEQGGPRDPNAPATPSAPVTDGALTKRVAVLGSAVETLEDHLLENDADLARVQETQRDNAADLVRALATVSTLTQRVDDLDRARRVEIVIKTPSADRTLPPGLHHSHFETLLRLAASLDPAERNIWIAGPAGSGKTTAARNLALALELDFEFLGAVDNPYKLSGFIDGNGTYHSTAFRRIYENGGVVLLDECDASSPAALLEINTHTSNSHGPFPDRMVPRHADTYVLCAANTWGLGGDANYVGRAKLDAAFLDRFVTLDWPYDINLERRVAACDVWVDCVQAVRARVVAQGAQMVISPRASIKGAQLLRAGVTPASVVTAVFGRYRSHSAWRVVGEAAEKFAALPALPTDPATPQTPVKVPTQGTPVASNLRVDFSGVRVFGQERR